MQEDGELGRFGWITVRTHAGWIGGSLLGSEGYKGPGGSETVLGGLGGRGVEVIVMSWN